MVISLDRILNISHYNVLEYYTVFEIVLSTLVDIQSTKELTFGGHLLIVVDRRNTL